MPAVMKTYKQRDCVEMMRNITWRKEGDGNELVESPSMCAYEYHRNKRNMALILNLFVWNRACNQECHINAAKLQGSSSRASICLGKIKVHVAVAKDFYCLLIGYRTPSNKEVDLMVDKSTCVLPICFVVRFDGQDFVILN